jgi:hypothetical protein
MSDKKRKILANIKPQEYQIYGIFDFENKNLIYVGLDLEAVELEFDLEGYDKNERYEVVEFTVVLI